MLAAEQAALQLLQIIFFQVLYKYSSTLTHLLSLTNSALTYSFFVIVFDQKAIFAIRNFVIIRFNLSRKAIGQHDSSFVPKLVVSRGYNRYYASNRKSLFYTHTISLKTCLSLWSDFGLGSL